MGKTWSNHSLANRWPPVIKCQEWMMLLVLSVSRPIKAPVAWQICICLTSFSKRNPVHLKKALTQSQSKSWIQCSSDWLVNIVHIRIVKFHFRNFKPICPELQQLYFGSMKQRIAKKGVFTLVWPPCEIFSNLKEIPWRSFKDNA